MVLLRIVLQPSKPNNPGFFKPVYARPMSTELSRRSVLCGLTAAAMHPTFRFAESVQHTRRFVFFSDTHVGVTNNIDANRRMLDEIRLLNPALVINGGDITESGWDTEYANWADLVRGLPFPIRCIPGNHDVRWSPTGLMAFEHGTQSAPYSSVDSAGLHFVLLDSTVPLSHWGHLESKMLRWLADDLKRVGASVPVVIATHHWVGRDTIQTDNELEFYRVIEAYNVVLILNGHGHSDLYWTWNGIPNVMCKGLYQGSYIVGHRSRSKLSLIRRTNETPITNLPDIDLTANEPRPPVQVFPKELVAGQLIALAHAGQYRWNAGEWKPIELSSCQTVNGIPGSSRLTSRNGETYRDLGEMMIVGSSGALRRKWSHQLSGGVMSHLLVEGDSLLVSAMDGSVTRLDRATGKPIWTAHTQGYCHSSPVVHNQVVFVGSSDGTANAFAYGTGQLLWASKTRGPVYASPAVTDGVVAFPSGDGTVYGLDPETGKEQWTYALPKSSTAFVQSQVAADEHSIYLGAWDKFLYCLDAKTGSLRWRRDCVGDRSYAYSPAIGGPSVQNGVVIVPANGNILWAFRAADGEILWKATSPGDKFGYSSPTVRDGRVYIGCLGDKGEARCLDAQTGSVIWTAATGLTIYDSSPAVGDGVVAIGSVASTLWLLDQETGTIKGQYSFPPGHFLSSPVIADRTVYAATYSDWCMAFDIV